MSCAPAYFYIVDFILWQRFNGYDEYFLTHFTFVKIDFSIFINPLVHGIEKRLTLLSLEYEFHNARYRSHVLILALALFISFILLALLGQNILIE